MTVRTLTEIMDIDDDTITMITVGPDEPYCAEVVVGQWATGERDPSHDIRVRLEITDAIALRDALTRCIDAAEVIE